MYNYNDALCEPFSRGDFYLIQRMATKSTPMRGIDDSFKLAYMGAAEFEWGAIPASIKAYNTLYEAGNLKLHEITTVVHVLPLNNRRLRYDQKFWVLVEKSVTTEEVQKVMDNLHTMRLKEGLYLEYNDPQDYDYADTWMCLTSPFVFFRNKESYHLFVDGLAYTTEIIKEHERAQAAN